MKTLTFDTKEKYEILYEALSVAEQGYRALEMRTISKIFDKLEAIGEPKEPRGYQLKFSEGKNNPEYPSINLEDAEFDLAVRTFDSVPFTGLGSRAAIKVYDWLHSL